MSGAPETPATFQADGPYTINITMNITYNTNATTGTTNGEHLGHSIRHPESDDESPEVELSDEELADIAQYFQRSFSGSSGCVPGVAWRRVAGGWRCTACLGALVHFLADTEIDNLVEDVTYVPVYTTGNVGAPGLREVAGEYWRDIIRHHYRRRPGVFSRQLRSVPG
ncbi:hypothetical protein LTS10_011755 [Elasticomyces elasticus]|nr:hypothetical protein LTS10_011755 [Elasticomyces elasticus]